MKPRASDLMHGLRVTDGAEQGPPSTAAVKQGGVRVCLQDVRLEQQNDVTDLHLCALYCAVMTRPS